MASPRADPDAGAMSLRIALSDDHPVVRAGVRALLEQAALEQTATEQPTSEQPKSEQGVSGNAEPEPVAETSGPWRVVAEAANPDELIDLLAQTPLDLLITDFSMPGDSRAGDGL